MANQSETRCWTCKNACGKCPWSECDKETRKLKWRPEECWLSIITKVLMNSCRGARRHDESSYIVTACPQYEVGLYELLYLSGAACRLSFDL